MVLQENCLKLANSCGHGVFFTRRAREQTYVCWAGVRGSSSPRRGDGRGGLSGKSIDWGVNTNNVWFCNNNE